MLKLIVPRYEDSQVLGLPAHGKAFAITNSQRRDLACMKRWWFRNAEGLRTQQIAAPLRYGTGWDCWLEDLNAWWMEHDAAYPTEGHTCPWCDGKGQQEEGNGETWECEECDGSGDGILVRIAEGWRRDFRDLQSQAKAQGWSLWVSEKEIEEQITKLHRGAHGYLKNYGAQPPANVKVVGVKLSVAAPVRVPSSGRIYRPEMWVIEEEDGTLRPARTGEARRPPRGGRVRKVKWPWYQVGELDRLAASRKTGALWVGEFKSSQDPKGYVEKQEIDPQVTGYTWMLSEALRAGLLAGEGNRFHRGGMTPETLIAGFTYDCTSSNMQHDPLMLKGTKKEQAAGVRRLSVAMNRTVPTWRFMEYCVENGIDPSLYGEHIGKLGAYDRKLYVRDFGAIGPEDIRRYQTELYGVAKRHAQAFRDAATATPQEVEWRFPRVAICRLPGGSCPYTTVCLEDGAGPREHFEIANPLQWSPREDRDDG